MPMKYDIFILVSFAEAMKLLRSFNTVIRPNISWIVELKMFASLELQYFF